MINLFSNAENTSFHYYDLEKILSAESDYQLMVAKISQQILMILQRNTEEFFSSERSL